MIQILLIEDSNEDHEIFATNIRGFRPPPPNVTRVTDLTSALVLMAAIDYDLILADLGLPGAPPESILDKVLAASRDAAVIILSGRGSYDLLQMALITEADGALSKNDPLGPRELESYILQTVHRNREALRRDQEHEDLKEEHRILRLEFLELRQELATLKAREEAQEDAIALARMQGKEEARGEAFAVSKWKVGAFVLVVTTLSTLAGALAGLL